MSTQNNNAAEAKPTALRARDLPSTGVTATFMGTRTYPRKEPLVLSNGRKINKPVVIHDFEGNDLLANGVYGDAKSLNTQLEAVKPGTEVMITNAGKVTKTNTKGQTYSQYEITVTPVEG